MIHGVPSYVTAGIRGYDSALRLRWSACARSYVLERKISNAAPGSYDALMATYARRVTKLKADQTTLVRALNENPLTDVEKELVEESAKRVARWLVQTVAELEAMKDGHLWIFFVPRPTANQPWPYRLRAILATVQDTDLVASGGVEANYREMVDQDAADRQKAETKRRGIIRDGAGELYDDIQRKTGERILLGANQKPEEPLIVAGV